jgi:putative FmdB family regulatory protein
VPIYEYECESCQKRFELMQKFSEKPLKKCIKCGGPVHKLLSAPALVFKGTGWYVTDYASPERKKAQKADGNGSPKPAETSTTKSATAAAKTDS